MRFQDLLRRDDETVAALTEALGRTEQAAADAVGRMEDLGRRRRAALLADDDKGLDGIERDLQLATRDRDRASLAKLELLDRIQAAQQAERQARLDTIHEQGMKAQEKAVALIRGRYAKAAKELAAVVAELDWLAGEVFDANRRLQAEGDPRVITPGDEVARPQRGGTIPLLPTPIQHGLRLPDPQRQRDSSRGRPSGREARHYNELPGAAGRRGSLVAAVNTRAGMAPKLPSHRTS